MKVMGSLRLAGFRCHRF